MAQEAKFELLNYRSNKRGVSWEGGESISFYDYIVKLTDADGEVIKYSITDYYNEESLKGKQVIGVCNFPEKNIAGVKSEFLVLGAIEEDGKVVLVHPSKPSKNGLRIA